MSTHESLEAARQIDQADHESQAFERSDAAKVAAVAALVEKWHAHAQLFVAPVDLAVRQDWEYIVHRLRKALADPDAALERVRAEAWDEGCASGISFQAGSAWSNNPYRAKAVSS